MGHHRLTFDMVGGHGCDRDSLEGQARTYCNEPSCPDCMGRFLVKLLAPRGVFSGDECGATITHWPGTPGEVVDDLLTGKRIKGDFR